VDSVKTPISASIGVAMIDAQTVGRDAALRDADADLYRAKTERSRA
jgi:GGDEF domain-containing protein